MQFAVPRRGVPPAASIRTWAELARANSAVTIRVAGTQEVRALNRSYRGIDRPTNVLSFAYARGRGDVVVCHPIIAREAREQGKSVAAHYAHLVIHGVLHLRGYDHASARAAGRMEKLEVRLLRRLGYANPYELK